MHNYLIAFRTEKHLRFVQIGASLGKDALGTASTLLELSQAPCSLMPETSATVATPRLEQRSHSAPCTIADVDVEPQRTANFPQPPRNPLLSVLSPELRNMSPIVKQPSTNGQPAAAQDAFNDNRRALRWASLCTSKTACMPCRNHSFLIVVCSRCVQSHRARAKSE
jgi:hypothetical protein